MTRPLPYQCNPSNSNIVRQEDGLVQLNRNVRERAPRFFYDLTNIVNNPRPPFFNPSFNDQPTFTSSDSSRSTLEKMQPVPLSIEVSDPYKDRYSSQNNPHVNSQLYSGNQFRETQMRKLSQALIQKVCDNHHLSCPRQQEVINTLANFLDDVLSSILQFSIQNAKHRVNAYSAPNDHRLFSYPSVPTLTNELLLFENIFYSQAAKKSFNEYPQPTSEKKAMPQPEDSGGLNEFVGSNEIEEPYEPQFVKQDHEAFGPNFGFLQKDPNIIAMQINILKRKEETRNVPLSSEIVHFYQQYQSRIEQKTEKMAQGQMQMQPQMQPPMPPQMQPQMPPQMPLSMQQDIPPQYRMMNQYVQPPHSTNLYPHSANRMPPGQVGISPLVAQHITNLNEKKSTKKAINIHDVLLAFSAPSKHLLKNRSYVTRIRLSSLCPKPQTPNHVMQQQQQQQQQQQHQQRPY